MENLDIRHFIHTLAVELRAGVSQSDSKASELLSFAHKSVALVAKDIFAQMSAQDFRSDFSEGLMFLEGKAKTNPNSFKPRVFEDVMAIVSAAKEKFHDLGPAKSNAREPTEALSPLSHTTASTDSREKLKNLENELQNTTIQAPLYQDSREGIQLRKTCQQIANNSNEEALHKLVSPEGRFSNLAQAKVALGQHMTRRAQKEGRWFNAELAKSSPKEYLQDVCSLAQTEEGTRALLEDMARNPVSDKDLSFHRTIALYLAIRPKTAKALAAMKMSKEEQEGIENFVSRLMRSNIDPKIAVKQQAKVFSWIAQNRCKSLLQERKDEVEFTHALKSERKTLNNRLVKEIELEKEIGEILTGLKSLPSTDPIAAYFTFNLQAALTLLETSDDEYKNTLADNSTESDTPTRLEAVADTLANNTSVIKMRSQMKASAGNLPKEIEQNLSGMNRRNIGEQLENHTAFEAIKQLKEKAKDLATIDKKNPDEIIAKRREGIAEQHLTELASRISIEQRKEIDALNRAMVSAKQEEWISRMNEIMGKLNSSNAETLNDQLEEMNEIAKTIQSLSMAKDSESKKLTANLKEQFSPVYARLVQRKMDVDAGNIQSLRAQNDLDKKSSQKLEKMVRYFAGDLTSATKGGAGSDKPTAPFHETVRHNARAEWVNNNRELAQEIRNVSKKMGPSRREGI